MRPTVPWRAAALLVVALTACAGCGGSSSTASPAGSDAPSDNSPTSAMLVVRTGGIAGVSDMVRIAGDGSASITTKARKTRGCTPSATALDRLRAVDLKAVAATTAKPSHLADGFNYSVKSGSASAVVSEGDDDSRRAELVDAAAAVVATCLASQSGSSSAGS